MKAIPLQKKLILRYKGIFDFDGLYKLMVQWLKARRYWFHEDVYKVKPSLSGIGKEFEIFWHGERKVTEYCQYRINVVFHMWDVTDVEVIQEGVKKTLMKCRMEIVFDAVIELDYQGKWEDTKFKQMLRDFYNNYIIYKKLGTLYHDELYYRIYKLHNLVKEYLDMQAKGYEFAGYLGDKY